ncbi:hypothetical protein M422DRAFT_272292 [Sphaerobolus stellatus SS14]|uniref:Uncharacterized protein n=1 Tax=Sphaerobolus stellatus (strain SS14) TaxID=990650 RepID=A0A0C9UBV8_SPHS4|nr:hypothetical protein M422DRAFT_272292 [Sphaerobolus stellatus SS14]
MSRVLHTASSFDRTLATMGLQSVAGVTHRKLLGQNYCKPRWRGWENSPVCARGVHS